MPLMYPYCLQKTTFICPGKNHNFIAPWFVLQEPNSKT